MKIKPWFQLCSVSVILGVMPFLLGSCGKRKTPDQAVANGISNQLAAITQAGLPVTTKELDDWYATPPAAENAAPVYAEAFAALTKDDPTSPGFASRNQAAISLLLKAAERRSCRYPMDLNAGSATLLPHLAPTKKSASLLEAETIAEAGRGRTDAATKAVLAGLQLGHSLDNEPLLISQLVRIAVTRITLSGLEQALTRRPFAEDELARLQTAVGNVGGFDLLARALTGERCLCIHAFQFPDELARQTGIAGTGAPALNQLAAYQKSPVWPADFDFALSYFASLEAATQKPVAEAMTSVAETGAQVGDAKAKGYLISSMMLPATGVGFKKTAELIAATRTAQAALAVERYRLKHNGVPPASLNELVPTLLPSVPEDPFDGKPLRYEKLAGKGYVVYSVGSDLQDNHGATTPPGSKTTAATDIAFTVRR